MSGTRIRSRRSTATGGRRRTTHHRPLRRGFAGPNEARPPYHHLVTRRPRIQAEAIRPACGAGWRIAVARPSSARPPRPMLPPPPPPPIARRGRGRGRHYRTGGDDQRDRRTSRHARARRRVLADHAARRHRGARRLRDRTERQARAGQAPSWPPPESGSRRSVPPPGLSRPQWKPRKLAVTWCRLPGSA